MKKTLLTIVVLAAAFCLSGCVVATYDEPHHGHPHAFYGPPGPVIEVVPVPGPHPYPPYPHHPRPYHPGPHPW